MSGNPLDVLILVVLAPGIAVVATWFLPWERWIPKKIPDRIIGPYLLYCAFAIWHFKQPRWVVACVGLWGVVVSGRAIFDWRRAGMLNRAREKKAEMLKEAQNWPVAEGFVLHISQSYRADRILNLTLSYMYKVQDEEFDGSELFTFTSNDEAERFRSRCRERKLKVRYQQDKPEICVLDRSAIG
jgi:hypothetical protein